jgi:hypothetical protein
MAKKSDEVRKVMKSGKTSIHLNVLNKCLLFSKFFIEEASIIQVQIKNKQIKNKVLEM